MKVAIALIALLALSGVALFFNESSAAPSLRASQDSYKQYQAWKTKFNKNANGVEDEYRFKVFSENLDFINEHNKKSSKVTLGLTEFADMTNEEFRTKMTTEITQAPQGNYQTFETNGDMQSINWIEKGAVTDVKNQGVCGSCWAFSTAAGLEGLYAISEGKLVSLSDQQITSCTPAPFSLGCNGGNPLFGYLYTANKGIETDASYPYVQENNPKTAACDYNKSDVVFQNKGVGQVPTNNPAAMNSALQNQPLSVAVDAGSIYFQLYSGGVLSNENCGDALNHAITLVGYESDNNSWIVKNSWGGSWGNKGYANILNAEGNGICGINMDVSFPTN